MDHNGNIKIEPYKTFPIIIVMLYLPYTVYGPQRHYINSTLLTIPTQCMDHNGKKNPDKIGIIIFWSGRPGSNWPPIAWKAIALPNELLPLNKLPL
jgi:hypothetical protein